MQGCVTAAFQERKKKVGKVVSSVRAVRFVFCLFGTKHTVIPNHGFLRGKVLKPNQNLHDKKRAHFTIFYNDSKLNLVRYFRKAKLPNLPLVLLF